MTSHKVCDLYLFVFFSGSASRWLALDKQRKEEFVRLLAGNVNHVAIGTDLDGGFGKEQCPSDLDTIADLQKLNNIVQFYKLLYVSCV